MLDINNLKTTNKLLLIIAVPLVFYILKLLSFIFIPLVLALFIALVFMPLVRWFAKKKVPSVISLFTVLLILASSIFVVIKVVQLSGKEIASGKSELYQKMDQKLGDHIAPYAEMLGIDTESHNSTIKSIVFDEKVGGLIYDQFGATFGVLRQTVSLILLTLFFLVLLLAGSLNWKDILQETMFKQHTRTIKTFMTIENNVVKFLKVKFFVSACTGIGFSVICIVFDISFPLFWGLFAFAINFVQWWVRSFLQFWPPFLRLSKCNFPGRRWLP